jgi:hypothetical protein
VSSEEAADQIRSALASLPSDSLRFFGEWFGGRRDNIHTIVGVTTEEDALVLRFNEGEALSVWDPTEITTTPATFRIQEASRLQWEWFYYGRPRAPENLHRMEYVRIADAQVRVTEHGDEPEPERVIVVKAGTPAVEMTSIDFG